MYWKIILTSKECTETDLKKFKICPIWGQADSIWMPNLTSDQLYLQHNTDDKFDLKVGQIVPKLENWLGPKSDLENSRVYPIGVNLTFYRPKYDSWNIMSLEFKVHFKILRTRINNCNCIWELIIL